MLGCPEGQRLRGRERLGAQEACEAWFMAWPSRMPLSISSCAYSLPRSTSNLRVSSPLRGARSTPASRPIVKYLTAVRNPLNIRLLLIPFLHRAPGLRAHNEAHNKGYQYAAEQGGYE